MGRAWLLARLALSLVALYALATVFLLVRLPRLPEPAPPGAAFASGDAASLAATTGRGCWIPVGVVAGSSGWTARVCEVEGMRIDGGQVGGGGEEGEEEEGKEAGCGGGEERRTVLQDAVVWTPKDADELGIVPVWRFLVAMAAVAEARRTDVVVVLPRGAPTSRLVDLQDWMAPARPQVALFIVEQGADADTPGHGGATGCYLVRRAVVVTVLDVAPRQRPGAPLDAATLAVLTWPFHGTAATMRLPAATAAAAAPGGILYVRAATGPSRVSAEDALVDALARRLDRPLAVLDAATTTVAAAAAAVQRAAVVIVADGASLLPVLAAAGRPLAPTTAGVVELFGWHEASCVHADVLGASGVRYTFVQGAVDPSYGLPSWPGPPAVADAASAVAWRDWQSPSPVAWTTATVDLLVREIAAHIRPGSEQEHQRPPPRYLMFMPWEQANNQLIGFRCACAMAHFLNRTLVLPYLGHPRTGARDAAGHWNYTFDVAAFAWQPMEVYFDAAALAQLPCRVVTYSEYTMWTRGAQSGDPLFLYNPLFKHTTADQLVTYYRDVLALSSVTSLMASERLYRLPEHKIVSLYGPFHDTTTTLALGTAFWMHDFGVGPQLTYPYRDYVDLVALSPLYARIVRQLVPRADLVDAGAALAVALRLHHGAQGRLMAAHVRGGPDYVLKCGKITNSTLQARCLAPPDAVVAALDLGPHDVVYIATDLDERAEALQALRLALHGHRVETWASLRGAASGGVGDTFGAVVRPRWTPIDLAMAEQELCAQADLFVGNLFSSFSRTILERRAVLGRPNRVL